MRNHLRAALVALLLAALAPCAVAAQDVRIRDLTQQGQTVPVRLMGYGIVIGLDGSGDRTSGGARGGGGPTVQSVANLLKRFDIEVPAEMLRTRNVAAVLVTAELSPYLRAGGRFDLHVSSLGDARSLRGGVLWMTPLVADAGALPVATAQGPLLLGEGAGGRGGYTVETTARIPSGGILEQEMPRPAFASNQRLILREPDLTTAVRIADAVTAAVGGGSATVEDPGSVRLTLPQGQEAVLLARIGELRVQPDRPSRLIIDGREGTIVAGGDLGVGAATVSHGALTLTVGGGAAGDGMGHIGVPVGTPVQEIPAALYAVQTPASVVAAIFESLRAAGALAAEVVIR
jgi:flagellar P-ring protein precursor FlgI